MIPESAMGLIQRLGQTIFTNTCDVMGERPWDSVVLKAQYDGVGGYVRNCQVLASDGADDSVAIPLTDEVDGPLLSLDECRIDANGKEWQGLMFTISQQGEVNIQLAYEPSEPAGADEI